MTNSEKDSSHPEVHFVLEPGARMPEYADPGASGMDVFALEDTVLQRNKVTRVKTGIHLAYLRPDLEIQIRARSGNTLKKNMLVANGPGSVDSSYRGPCDCLLLYISDEYGDILKLKAGDKIAQFIVAPVVRPKIIQVDKVTDQTQRGDTGFGASDTRTQA